MLENVLDYVISHAVVLDLINAGKNALAKDMEMSMVHVIVREWGCAIRNVYAKVLAVKVYHPELRNVRECVTNFALAKVRINVIKRVHAKDMET